MSDMPKIDDIKRIIVNIYDPKGMVFVGGWEGPFDRDSIPEYRQRILRLKKVIPSLYGMGVRKPITKLGYLVCKKSLAGRYELKGHIDQCFLINKYNGLF